MKILVFISGCDAIRTGEYGNLRSITQKTHMHKHSHTYVIYLSRFSLKKFSEGPNNVTTLHRETTLQEHTVLQAKYWDKFVNGNHFKCDLLNYE